jgi:polyphosphate kinase 2 (PPK2 family)
MAGEAVFWDRGPAGDSVYGSPTRSRSDAMGQEFETFEAGLRDDGILVVKIELFADADKQARTFGKRLGRQFIAQTIKNELGDTKQLSPEQEAQLDFIASKVDEDDFSAFTQYEDIQARFLSFVKDSKDISPWLLTDATQRHKARLKLIRGFDKALRNFETSSHET